MNGAMSSAVSAAESGSAGAYARSRSGETLVSASLRSCLWETQVARTSQLHRGVALRSRAVRHHDPDLRMKIHTRRHGLRVSRAEQSTERLPPLQHPMRVSGRRQSCCVEQPVVAALFKFEGEFLATGSNYPAVCENVHEVGNDVIEEPLIVRDDDCRIVRATQCVHATSHDAECIDVETGIRFVENRELGLQHRHLQNLVALFLATRKSCVYRSVEH